MHVGRQSHSLKGTWRSLLCRASRKFLLCDIFRPLDMRKIAHSCGTKRVTRVKCSAANAVYGSASQALGIGFTVSCQFDQATCQFRAHGVGQRCRSRSTPTFKLGHGIVEHFPDGAHHVGPQRVEGGDLVVVHFLSSSPACREQILMSAFPGAARRVQITSRFVKSTWRGAGQRHQSPVVQREISGQSAGL